jgi:tRNA pseudouridine13 synthase
MKLKQTPADFRVEELTDVRPEPDGPFAFYRLHKIGWTTPDAIQAIARRWDLRWNQFGYGGLKDRHADTTQFLTILHGPKRNLSHQRIELTHLGQTYQPYNSRDIRANRFGITVRHLTALEEAAITTAVESVKRTGVPNYFDDQRFGSVTADGRFVARELVHGRFEEALKLALVAPYEFDRADEKREKQILTQHWGEWPACKAKLPKGHARSLVTYLCDHPTNFKGAVARLRPELQGLYLSAYQSELWNRVLAKWIAANFPPEQLGTIRQHRGDQPAPISVPEELADRWNQLVIPLPSPRLKPEPSADYLPHLEAVLAEEQLTLKQLKVQGMDKPFFSKGERARCLRPDGLTIVALDDDLNPGRRKLTLRFDLPRGCYATMVVKRLVGQTAGDTID